MKHVPSRLPKPVLYQWRNGERSAVAGRYAIASSHEIGFQVAAYDKSRPLVIDPMVVDSTCLGGSGGDEGLDIVVDGSDNAYVTGWTPSSNFPTTAGVHDTAFAGLFVARPGLARR